MSGTEHHERGSRPMTASQRLAQVLFFGVFILGMLFALPTMLVLTVGLLPTLVAFVVDLHPRKYATRAVGFLNIAGTLPFLISLWTGPHSLMEAMKILTDVVAWLVIYASAAFGWVLHLWMPTVAGFILQANAVRRLRRLESDQKRLVAQWGKGIESHGAPKGRAAA